MTELEKLMHVQQELIAPKGNYNSFGKYKYRSCEDIMEAVKPLLAKYKAALTVTDTIEEINGRVYVKAVATFWDAETKEWVRSEAYAREPEDKKGMDESQITGATSSYARKYALNGLFCIDDTKDADTMDNTGAKSKKKDAPAQQAAQPAPAPAPAQAAPAAHKNSPIITTEQGLELLKRAKSENINTDGLLKLYKVEYIKDLTVEQYNNIMSNWEKVKEKFGA